MPVHLRVRAGELVDSGSWLYVWRRGDAKVVYVGATGLPPAVRTWLHLHSDDPNVARVRSAYPRLDSEELDVVAFELPAGVPRTEAKAELVHRLEAAGRLAETYVVEETAGPTRDRVIGDAVTRIVEQLLA